MTSPFHNLNPTGLLAFLPLFFRRAYPPLYALYALLNAIVVAVGGSVAALSGGALADHWRPHNPRVWSV